MDDGKETRVYVWDDMAIRAGHKVRTVIAAMGDEAKFLIIGDETTGQAQTFGDVAKGLMIPSWPVMIRTAIFWLLAFWVAPAILYPASSSPSLMSVALPYSSYSSWMFWIGIGLTVRAVYRGLLNPRATRTVLACASQLYWKGDASLGLAHQPMSVWGRTWRMLLAGGAGVFRIRAGAGEPARARS
ncbi:MAG: hypothetical protein WDO73_22315 [Ignavibacteriota bacterium]